MCQNLYQLQQLTYNSFVSINYSENCLEVITFQNDQLKDEQPQIKKINYKFKSQITAILTPPERWFNGQPKTPFQLAQDDGCESTILIATQDGNLTQYKIVISNEIQLQKADTLNLKKYITSIDETHQIFSMQWSNYDPNTIIVATETGYLINIYVSNSVANANIAFKHTITQLSNINTFAIQNQKSVIVGQKNSLLIYNINKQNSQPENVIVLQDNNDIINIACSYTTCACITSQGFYTYNQLGQLIQLQHAPQFDSFTYLQGGQDNNNFYVATANGVFECYTSSGLLEDVQVSAQNLGATLALQQVGSVFYALCYGGFCKIIKTSKQVNIGQVQINVIDGTKLLINDKKNQISDVYCCNEYITGIFTNMWSKVLTICVTTKSRVFTFTQQGANNQWIQMPACTQQLNQQQTIAGQRSSVSSILKQIPLGAKASNKFVVITDNSSIIKILTKDAMSIIQELKVNCVNIEQIVVTDEIVGIFNQNKLLLINITTGTQICRPFIHNKKILKCAISCGQIVKEDHDQLMQNNQQNIGAQFGNVWGLSANSQMQTQHQQNIGQQKPYIAIVDSNNQCLVTQITKYEQNQQINFQLCGVNEKVLDIQFAQNSQVLTLLIQNSIQLPAPEIVYYNSENVNTNNSLRLVQIANPLQYDSQIFYTQESINLSHIQKAISLIGNTEINSLTLSVQQMLQQSITAQIKTILKEDNVTYVETQVYDALYVKLPLLQFPLLLEQNLDNPQQLKRICLFVNSKQLWQQCYYIAKQIDDQDLLQQSLVHSNNVAVALTQNENNKSVEELIGAGQYDQAVQELCSQWKFEEALEIARKGQNLEKLVIQLRRDAFKDLGGIADERNQVWSEVVKRNNM